MSGQRVKEKRSDQAAEVLRSAVADATLALAPLFNNLNERLRQQDQRLVELDQRLGVLEGQPQSRLIHLP